MKKVKVLLLLCVFAILSTGCVKYNATMNINKDKSMNFEIIYAFDKTMFGEDGKMKEEDFAEVKKQGFTVTEYKNDNYEGFTFTKKIANIDEVSTESDVIYDLSGMMEAKEGNNYLFKVVKGEKKNTYTAKFKFDSNDSGLNTNDDEQETPDEVLTTGENDTETVGSSNSLDSIDLSSLTAGLDLSFNVNLPNSAISSNATTKENDNKKLSWKLNTNGQEFIEFSFELDNNAGNSMLLYVGIGVAVLAIVAVIVVVLSKKKKETPIQQA